MATQTTTLQRKSTSSGFNWGLGLTIISGILMLTALYMALVWAPMRPTSPPRPSDTPNGFFTFTFLQPGLAF